MEKQAFLEELKNLVSNEDVLAINRDVNELRTRFDDFIIEEERKKQVAVLDAQARGEDVQYEREDDPIRNEFYEVFKSFKAIWTAAMDAKKSFQQENLKQKKSLIQRLKTIIESEENIGAAYTAYKEIHEKWKTIGEIDREKRAEVQAEYSRLLEDFFYNMKIYREIKEYDFHKNQQLKEAVIQKVEELAQHTSIKEIESSIKVLQNEWDEIGPVNRDLWEAIRNKYHEAVRAVYTKINAHYEGVRQIQLDNMDKKQALLEKAKTVVAGLTEVKTVKAWEEITQELLKIQEVWKQIGFGPKKENEEIWHLFRAECDAFFAQKKAFYETVRSEYDAIAEKKKQIIEEADKVKDSTDWKKTSDFIVNLQKRWKNLGNAGQRNEQRLWKEFRAICDHFFNAKQAYYAQLDQANEANLVAKKEIIAKIEAYTVAEDKQQALNDLRDFTNAFNAIGHVPIKEKDTIYHAYKSAIDAHYQALKLEGEEKDRVLFQSKIETLKASPNADKLMEKERAELRKQMDHLKQDIIQYENNLGFFANSKGANELKKEVERKIQQAKNKIEELKRKVKLLANEQVY